MIHPLKATTEIENPEEKILVLSDIHIGRKGAYWRNALKLMSSHNWKTIIIAGDFIDIWYTPTAIFALLLSTLFRKIGDKIIYVTGNHDKEIKELLFSNEPFKYVASYYSLKIGEKNFNFVHGHEVDKFNNEISWFGEFLTKMQALIHKIFKVDSHGLTSGFIFKKREEKQRKELIEKYCKNKNSVLVFGHTHQPFGSDNCYNTGDWVKNRTFLTIDEEGKVKRYKEVIEENQVETFYEEL